MIVTILDLIIVDIAEDLNGQKPFLLPKVPTLPGAD
jgi:hypothetical protein